MKRFIYTLIVIMVLPVTLLAQSRKELIELGDGAMKKGNYGSAVYFFRKIIFGTSGKDDVTYPYEIVAYGGPSKKKSSDKNVQATDENEIYALHKLSDAYYKLHDYENAEKFYAQAAQNKSPLFPDVKYWYGMALMSNAKYSDAQKQFQEYITEGTGLMIKQAELQDAGCEFAMNDTTVAEGVNLMLLDSSFNKGSATFGVEYYTDNAIVFSSARKENNVKDPKKEDPNLTTDFYISNNEGNGWEMPQHLIGPINSAWNEGAGAMGVDRTTFYFTRWNPNDKSDCNIYVSKMFNRRWLEPLKIESLNMDGFRTMHPALTLDETRLYFVSDRPGGQGGLDIWFCPIDEDGNLGVAQNIGAPINTPADEITPYYHYQSQTLFFSSNGHSGFGGFDIYKSHFSEDDNSWANATNLGKPFNSEKDEDHYIMDKDQLNGFLTSDREPCTTCDSTSDMKPTCQKIYAFNKPNLKFTLSGYVYDGATEEIIPNALVTFKDVKGDMEPFFLTTDEKGYYFTELRQDQELFLKAQKVKYFADAATVTTVGLTASADLEQDFYLRQIPSTDIEIPGIEYDFDKTTLRPKSIEILDKLYDFLALNDNLIVEIKSHTDCRGNDAYNQKLSQGRAQSCVDYLISKGIKKERIIPQGKGESEPIPGHECDTIEKLKKSDPDKFEEMHQRNRRTAFRVVKEGDPNNPVLQGGK